MGLVTITRKEAKANGYRLYFTGNPCTRGRIAARITTTGNCTCLACGEARKGIKAKSYRNTKGSSVKSYLEKNKEKLSEQARLYREQNKVRISTVLSRYYKEHPEKYRAYRRKRKAKLRTTIPAWFGEFDALVISEAAELCQLRETETEIEWHVDHMIPLQAKKACGLHCAENLQVIPASINRSKNNKMIFTARYEWIA